MSPDGKVDIKAIDSLRDELIKEADVDIYGESALALLKDGSYDSGSVEILRDKITSIIKKRLLRVKTRNQRSGESTISAREVVDLETLTWWYLGKKKILINVERQGDF